MVAPFELHAALDWIIKAEGLFLGIWSATYRNFQDAPTLWQAVWRMVKTGSISLFKKREVMFFRLASILGE